LAAAMSESDAGLDDVFEFFDLSLADAAWESGEPV